MSKCHFVLAGLVAGVVVLTEYQPISNSDLVEMCETVKSDGKLVEQSCTDMSLKNVKSLTKLSLGEAGRE
ncbi:hypothetical protein [Methylobacterium aquaticum]|jgi:hypothetical protein|uniref:Uncharacterized protein n=1 Tax=Methylobacterium aquaticum TaxID=270351 RepID=A0A0J6V861_9HYPH|nr:hypothetical protein [Methylobacterium aquaticum]KMO35146.1 hypothetical protein VP06_12950 [Methylobacterium aquaticum]